MSASAASAGRAATFPPPGLARELATVALLFAATVVLLSLIQPPVGVWPAALLCLAPWTIGVCRTGRAWVVHWLSFIAGAVYFLINLRWLLPVTGLGYAALAAYLAIYWPLAAWAIRAGRRHGVSPLWTLPVVWVACEYLRAWVMTGFPWLFLAHAFYARILLIQISDITGAYGVTFVVALLNGLLADLALRFWRRPGDHSRTHPLWIGPVATGLVLTVVLTYGYVRLRQARFEPGPRVAVVQDDFPLVSTPPYGDHEYVILASYLRVAADAARERPDLLVFPETVWSAVQNFEFIEVERHAVDAVSVGAWAFGRRCDRAVSAFARGDYRAVNAVIDELEAALRRSTGDPRVRPGMTLPRLPEVGGPPVTVVVGSVAIETFPEATYPKEKRYNSALVYDPDGRQRRVRYDKIHLVPFGEIVPFRNTDFHWLYRWLNRLSPFSRGGQIEYSLSPGETWTIFELNAGGRTTAFGVPICYEDVMPYVPRRFTWDGPRRRADFLVNISNDGWFQHSAELPQHLAICAFRAVENRVSIARAVNTGISGFVDPNGRIYAIVEAPGRPAHAGISGYRADHVWLDQRTSLYGRSGDWFAGACLALSGVLWVEAIVVRWVLAIRLRIRSVLKKRGHADARTS